MLQRILVPLDGSPAAEHAIPVAARLARKAHGSVVLYYRVAPLNAVEDSVVTMRESFSRTGVSDQMITEAARYLATVQSRYTEDLMSTITEIDLACDSVPGPFISPTSLKCADLIVMCCHRGAKVGQWNLERLAVQPAHQKHIPLLIVDHQRNGISELDRELPLRILLPLDGSSFAETALKPALQLLSQWGGPGRNELCLIRIVDLLAGEEAGEEEAHMSAYTARQARREAERYLHAVADRLRESPGLTQAVSITCLVTIGVGVVSAILKQTECSEGVGAADQCYLIAMATHGHEERLPQGLGSIAEHILNSTNHSLLLIPPEETVVRPVKRAELVNGAW